MSRVPRIRFKGFEEDWEQRKLGEMCQITMGQSPDGSTYSETPSDFILVQGNADLKDGWIFPRIWTTQKTKTADAGDLIMSVRAPAGAMGKTAYNVVLGRGVAGIKGNEFIYQSLVNMDSDGYWKKLAAGSTFESINSDVVNGAELIIPQDIEEQIQIGSFFANLDHLITLHQSKSFWYILKSIVSCTLYWEQRKLGGVVGITSGFMSDFLLSDGKYHLTRIETIADGIVDENRVGYSNEKPDDMYLLKHGDILYSNINSISHMGKVAKYQGNSPLYHGINLLRLQPENNINSDFLLYLLNTEKCRNWAKTRANQAVSQASINQSLLTTQEIAISSFEEQKKIGDYFHNLDHLITLHQLEPYNLIFKAIAYRIIDYAKSKPPRCIK